MSSASSRKPRSISASSRLKPVRSSAVPTTPTKPRTPTLSVARAVKVQKGLRFGNSRPARREALGLQCEAALSPIRAFFGSLLLLEERLQLRDHVEILGPAGGALEDNKAPQRNTQKVDAIDGAGHCLRRQVFVGAAPGHLAQQIEIPKRGLQREVQAPS